jgi:hypothetical protein
MKLLFTVLVLMLFSSCDHDYFQVRTARVVVIDVKLVVRLNYPNRLCVTYEELFPDGKRTGLIFTEDDIFAQDSVSYRVNSIHNLKINK